MQKTLLAVSLIAGIFASTIAEAEVSERSDENTGIKQLICSPTMADSQTFVLASCDLYPRGSKQYYVPQMNVIFGPFPLTRPNNRHPEWIKVLKETKAIIYTPYKQLPASITCTHTSRGNTLRVKILPVDYKHLVQCQKARIVSGKIGITLRAVNLREMKTIIDWFGDAAAIVPKE